MGINEVFSTEIKINQKVMFDPTLIPEELIR